MAHKSPGLRNENWRKPMTAAAYRKVRNDHSTETAEDYVEAVSDIVHRKGLCRVKDLADHMGVSHVTVTRIVSRLQERGLIETEPYKPIRLTSEGAMLAARSRTRHETVLAFLRAIGVPEDDARRDTEGIEHHVGQATLARMAEFAERSVVTHDGRD
ncbi:MAG TPA: manganese-binding transcriptional regulator MntR [Phycisphaerales bacterium]|nr:manganese-binding transcriptional regulator MntR [Phycisphaerales bacterium]